MNKKLNQIKLVCFVLLITLLFEQCKEKENDKANSITSKEIYSKANNKTSIINLISNPNNYNKKNIQVKGFVNFEFENCAIYLSKEDYDKGIDKNGIWIQMSKEDVSKYHIYSNKYVIIEGVFDMKNNGHENNYSGALNELSRIQVIN